MKRVTVQAVVWALVPMLVLGQQTSVCLTPTGDAGVCKSLRTCPVLRAIFNNTNRTPQQTQQLRQALCGWDGRYPRVCCPEGRGVPVTLPSKCGRMATGMRIYGGEVTNMYDYPWMVLIEYKSPRDYKVRLGCGGSLISEQHVLTAAHCVKGAVLSNLGNIHKVRLGEWDKRDAQDCTKMGDDETICADPILRLGVDDVIPHQQYRATRQQHDIALIKLSAPAPYTEFIRPVCLAKMDVSGEASVDFRAAGWGETEAGRSSEKKLHVLVPLVGLMNCQQRYRSAGLNVSLWEKQLCAGGNQGQDACRGDSGGPLMNELDGVWSLHGVVSFGPTPCGYKDVPGVYTKVYAYLNWIRDNMRQ